MWKKNNNKDNKCQISFTKYLFNELTKYQKNKKKYIQELASDLNNNAFEIIKKVYNDLQNELNIIIDKNVDLEEKNGNEFLILKAFYKSFIDRIIQPEYSESVFQILCYFNTFIPNEKLIENPIIKEEKKREKQFSKEINQLIDIYKEIKNTVKIKNDDNITKLEKNLNYLEILNQDIL